MAQDKSYGTINIMAQRKWDNGTGQELWHKEYYDPTQGR